MVMHGQWDRLRSLFMILTASTLKNIYSGMGDFKQEFIWAALFILGLKFTDS